MQENKVGAPLGVSELALSLVVDRLREYGNGVSEEHRRVLGALCAGSERMLSGNLRGRVRFALPCGMGKTTTVLAVIKAIHELGLPHRVVVASTKVEELCEMKRRLIHDWSVRDSSIGLIHSYQYNSAAARDGWSGFATEPSSNHDAQFLLVTHANVRGGVTRGWMSQADLVFFDESLIVGSPLSLPLTGPSGSPSVHAEVGDLVQRSKKLDPTLAPAATVVSEIADQLVDRIVSGGSRTVTVRPRSPSAVRKALELLTAKGEDYPNVCRLLEWADKSIELRAWGTKKGKLALVTYEVTVPDELDRVFVLDASDPIRDLVHHDRRMVRAEDVLPELEDYRAWPGGMAAVKQHGRVQVFHANGGGGRSTMKRKYRDDHQDAQKLVRLLKSKPEEPFLVFTYKARPFEPDMPSIIMKEVNAAGIDPTQLVSGATGDPVRRLSVCTWGHETGSNGYSEYSNVVLWGVIRKPETAVAGTFLGQVDNLRDTRLEDLCAELVESEARHSALQAMNRACMRLVSVVGGVTQALPCSVYILHRDRDLETTMKRVLPGAPPWKPWRDEGERMTAENVVKLLRQYLADLGANGHRSVSSRRVKQAVCPKVPQKTYNRAKHEAVDGSGWVSVGHNLCRLAFEAT